MTPQTAILKFRTRLNKIHSSDYDNIPDWAAVEAINKAALEITRNSIHGNNRQQEGDEETQFRIDDLQFLLKSLVIKPVNKTTEFFELDLPPDYLWYKRIIPKASKGGCKRLPIFTKLVEEANVPVLLQDWAWEPSWEWRATFHTILNDRIRIYTKGKFTVDQVDAVYYRKPVRMDIVGYQHVDGTSSNNVDLEFKDDLADVIIDYAASISAGDIESPNQTEINLQRSNANI